MAVSDDRRAMFGTDEPPLALERIELGPLSFLAGETAVRTIAWHGSELVRSIDYPIRDGEWGTFSTRTLEQAASRDAAGGYRYRRAFETEEGSVAGRFELAADAAGRLTLHLVLTIRRDVRLCRAGFTLLHPIAGLAGEKLTIVRPDGGTGETVFPLSIAPSQPATDIAGLRYAVGGSAVDIAMAGDRFEMEDQRNWTDASYKTYGITASFPFAFEAKAGECIEQTLTLGFSGAGRAGGSAEQAGLRLVRGTGERFPELALAVEAGWPTATALPPALAGLRRLVRLDLRQAPALAALGLPGGGAPVDLELIVGDDTAEIKRQLQGLAEALAALGVVPQHVMALPAAYLKSYQPDGKWPTGASPADASAAARRAFPQARIGGGALTNFTELNRCRPDPAGIDYLTHGTAAIVHAADDLSVFQTLEALPQIFASARAMAPDKPYRLGLTAIGARSNPYGAGLAKNPAGRRVTMTDADPRMGSLFGAAWLVGFAAATAGADIELLTLAAAGGPFGLTTGPQGPAPGLHVLRWLAAMQGQERLRPLGVPRDVHVVAVAAGQGGASALVANGSAVPQQVEWAGDARLAVLDAGAVRAAAAHPDWVERTLAERRGPLSLPPYAVAFVAFNSLPGGAS